MGFWGQVAEEENGATPQSSLMRGPEKKGMYLGVVDPNFDEAGVF